MANVLLNLKLSSYLALEVPHVRKRGHHFGRVNWPWSSVSLCEHGNGHALVPYCIQWADGSSLATSSEQTQWWIQMAVRQLCFHSKRHEWMGEAASFGWGQFSKRAEDWGLSDGCTLWTWGRSLSFWIEKWGTQQGLLQSTPSAFGSWPATTCTVSMRVYLWCMRVSSWEGLSLESGSHAENWRTIGLLIIPTPALMLHLAHVLAMASFGNTCFGNTCFGSLGD